MTKPKPAKGKDGRFLPGNNGGGGRPTGSRNKLSEVFLDALCTDFEAHGAAVIERVRLEEPAAYLRTVASIMPKKVEVDAVDDLSHLTDAQLTQMLRQGAARGHFDIPEDEAMH